MSDKLAAVMMLGPEGDSPAEQLVAGARQAAARDALERLAGLPRIGRIYVLTPERAWAEANSDLPACFDFDPPGQAFHFGRRLAGVVERYGLRRVLYLGAASLPLLSRDELAGAIESVAEAHAPMAVTNNPHSSDWIGLAPADVLTRRPDRLINDNALGWVLRAEAGYDVRGLPASAGTRMDIDTPADLLFLRLHPATSGALRAYLDSARLDSARLRAAARRLAAPGGQIALVGRVSSAVWAYVEAHTQAWIRVFSEERGMAASGRQADGQVRSLLAAHLAAVGEAQFFAELAEMAEAVFFDTRVLLAHHRLWPRAADRYASDLGQPDRILDPTLRGLTEAALAAPMPVILGGHGVVSGGLYALIETIEAGNLG